MTPDFNEVKELSKYMRNMLGSLTSTELVDSYYDARNGVGIYKGTRNSKLATILRCFAGEFKRRGIPDYI